MADTAMMSGRQQRGLMIAALAKFTMRGNKWVVPSQSAADKKYEVSLESHTCSCADHQDTGLPCKHQYALEFFLKREFSEDGTVVETRQLLFQERKTYTQNWPAYDKAQSVEKERFQQLIFDLVQGVKEPERTKCGRKPHTHRDSIFAMTYKVYSLFSSRRFSTDLRDAHERGYVSCVIPGTKVCKFLENPEFTPILKNLIAKSALPLRAVESQFAIDSSGFASSKFERWYDEKYLRTKKKCRWVKVHIACGTRTNVVTAVRILDQNAGDAPQFAPLVRETANGFQITEMSADKAYASLENFEAVAECGGEAFIAFKSNHTGGIGGLFEKMFGYFQFKRDEYMAHYHRRSNVESTFSAIKRKFGDAVKSKNETAMVNESLCKILAHNLCCLIHEQHELGIDPTLWENKAVTHRSLTL